MTGERIGVTFVEGGVPVVYQDGGVDVFETDVPYLLSDTVSLMSPLPVEVVAGPVLRYGTLVDPIPVMWEAGEQWVLITGEWRDMGIWIDDTSW